MFSIRNLCQGQKSQEGCFLHALRSFKSVYSYLHWKCKKVTPLNIEANTTSKMVASIRLRNGDTINWEVGGLSGAQLYRPLRDQDI